MILFRYLVISYCFRLSKFKKMKAEVEKREWVEAAAEMKDSLWYTQVGVRGEELVNRMKDIK